MNLASLATVKSLAQKYNITPKRFSSQNFLIDARAVSRIIDAANLSTQDTALEIGPGFGVLTRAIAEYAGYVIAVEKDSRMVEALAETLADIKNIEVMHNDALLATYPSLPNQFKLISNLPFSITSATIQKFLSAEHQPSRMVVLLQREVAERIVARPPHTGFLSVFAQFFGDAEIISYVGASSFWPRPRVESAVVRVKNIKHRGSSDRERAFFNLVGRAFRNPRRQTKHVIPRELLARAEIDPSTRPGAVSMESWMRMFHAFEIFDSN